MPTYTAQQAFQAFLDNQASTTYAWPETAEAQDTEMREYSALKVAAMKEQKANAVESDAALVVAQQAEIDALTAEMVTKGYSGTGTLADFIKLYTRPDLNSTNSEALATSYFNANESFLQHYRINRQVA